MGGEGREEGGRGGEREGKGLRWEGGGGNEGDGHTTSQNGASCLHLLVTLTGAVLMT